MKTKSMKSMEQTLVKGVEEIRALIALAISKADHLANVAVENDFRDTADDVWDASYKLGKVSDDLSHRTEAPLG